MLIFWGPYSNLEATKTLLKQMSLQKISPSNTICTGDICAYCADPFLTSEAIKKSRMYVVKWNCEESLWKSSDNCGCGFWDKAESCSSLSSIWYNYALQELTKKQKKWMTELPDLIAFEYNNKKILVCHWSPDIINEFMFESVSITKKNSFLEKYNCDIIIAGHTWIPYIQNLWNDKYWVNAWVIWIPANDWTNDWFYITLNDSIWEEFITFERLTFDYKITASKMREKKLSEEYAENIETGLWPNIDILPESWIERKNVWKSIIEWSLNL